MCVYRKCFLCCVYLYGWCIKKIHITTILHFPCHFFSSFSHLLSISHFLYFLRLVGFIWLFQTFISISLSLSSHITSPHTLLHANLSLIVAIMWFSPQNSFVRSTIANVYTWNYFLSRSHSHSHSILRQFSACVRIFSKIEIFMSCHIRHTCVCVCMIYMLGKAQMFPISHTKISISRAASAPVAVLLRWE